MIELQTDPDLLVKLREGAKRGPTAEEVRHQKVSFIVSNLSDGKTTVTAAQVTEVLNRMAGNP